MGDLVPVFATMKALSGLDENEIKAILQETYQNMNDEIDFEVFLRVSLRFSQIMNNP